MHHNIKRFIVSKIVVVPAPHTPSIALSIGLPPRRLLPSATAAPRSANSGRRPWNDQEWYPHIGVVPCPEAIHLKEQTAERAAASAAVAAAQSAAAAHS